MQKNVAPKPQGKTFFHKYATRLIDKAVPIAGTLGEQYLHHRHITVSPGKHIVFHPRVNTFIPDVQFTLAAKDAPVSGLRKTYQFIYSQDRDKWTLTCIAPGKTHGKRFTLEKEEQSLLAKIAEEGALDNHRQWLFYNSAAHSQTDSTLKKVIEKLTTLRTEAHRKILRSEGNTLFRPALLAIATAKDDRDPIAQATYLDPDTALKADLALQKRTMGRLRDEKGQQRHVALTPKPSGNISFIAEGVETGLSIKETLPKADVVVALGIEQFKNIDTTRLSDTVIIVCDNDGKAIDENVAIQRAFAALIAEGKQVYALIPDLL